MLKIDEQKCIGCGMCVSNCEEVFKINETTHKAEVITQEYDAFIEKVDKAIAECPTQAIVKE